MTNSTRRAKDYHFHDAIDHSLHFTKNAQLNHPSVAKCAQDTGLLRRQKWSLIAAVGDLNGSILALDIRLLKVGSDREGTCFIFSDFCSGCSNFGAKFDRPWTSNLLDPARQVNRSSELAIACAGVISLVFT